MNISKLIDFVKAVNLPFVSYDDKRTAYLLSMDALGTLQACVRRNGRAGMFEEIERVDVNEAVTSYTADTQFNLVEHDTHTPCIKHTKETNQKKKKKGEQK